MFSATVMEDNLESGNFECHFGLEEVLKLPFVGGFGNCVYGFGKKIWFGLGKVLKLGILY